MPKTGDAGPQAQGPAAMALQAKFKLGLVLHQQGKLVDAKRIYGEILRQQPNSFDALHMLGVIAIQTGQKERAVDLLEKAIALNAKVPAAHNNLGTALNDLWRSDEALASYDRAIALTADDAEAHYNRGNALMALKRPEDALMSYDKAIFLKPTYAEACNNRGIALRDLMRFEEALESYEKAISLNSDFAEAHSNLGRALNDLRRPTDALASYDRAIALQPGYAIAYNNRGNTLVDLQRPEDALISYDKAIALKPDFVEAHNNRGNILMNLKRLDDAFISYDMAIVLKPNNAEAHYGRGNTLKELKRPEDALLSYDKAIAFKPDHAEAHNNRGNILRELKRPEDALLSYDKAIAFKPDHAEAHNNRGNILRELKRVDEALVSYDTAIALRPNIAEFYNNRGNALLDLKRPEDALVSYDKAISLKPDFVEALNNRGNTLKELGRLQEALVSYDRALALKPDFADAYYNLGNAFVNIKHYDEALAAYDKALALNPDQTGAEGARLHTKKYICDWSNFDVECAHLISTIWDGKINTAPFPLLSIPSSSGDQLQCSKLWIANKYPASDKSTWQGEQYDHRRIRVAYLSADFHDHPMAHLMAGVFESHDKKRFDTFAFSFGPDSQGEVRTRLKAAFEQFIDVRGASDRDVATLLREFEIDIAVDRKGFTTDSRTGIFAFRPAPIQVNYLAYPGTMGAEYIDYILADRFVIPEEDYRYFSEKVVYLPNSYQANDSKRRIAELTPSRTELGLPEQGFVFCCFNNNYKITPLLFDCWMRVLKRVEGSVLWLLESNASASSNLRNEAEARGVNAERIIFAKRLPLAEHLARHRRADLFLDTVPYNAHTTASDALWVGLPILTCLGKTFAGRVAASLLNAICLPELITTTLDAYEHMAIDLATRPDQLTIIKRRLADKRLLAPLFDTKLFTRHIEAAFVEMYKRHQAGLNPDHIVITET